MNIFYLHTIAPICASYHADKHVGKMLIESCQMLATAHHIHGNGDKVSYKPTHVNHPSNVWVRQSQLHYRYLADLALYLGIEFRKRYGHNHKSATVLRNELMTPPPSLLKMPGIWHNPPLAMPEEFHSLDTVDSYRRFYVSKQDRMPLVYYKGERQQPFWFYYDQAEAA
jgi:hypothetical protein